MTKQEAFKTYGKENFLPTMVSFELYHDPNTGREIPSIIMAWKAPAGTKLQVLHSVDCHDWEPRPNIFIIPQWGTINDTADVRTGPYDMAFIMN